MDYLVGFVDDPRPTRDLVLKLRANAARFADLGRSDKVDEEEHLNIDSDDFIGVNEIVASAGTGAEVIGERITDRIKFRRPWMRKHGMQAHPGIPADVVETLAGHSTRVGAVQDDPDGPPLQRAATRATQRRRTTGGAAEPMRKTSPPKTGARNTTWKRAPTRAMRPTAGLQVRGPGRRYREQNKKDFSREGTEEAGHARALSGTRATGADGNTDFD